MRKPGRTLVQQRTALAIIMLILLAGAILEFYSMMLRATQTSDNTLVPGGPKCKGTAACFSETVTYIVDGDTLDVGARRVRLALVNTPEVGRPGYAAAKQFTSETCPVGSHALVDEDDGQTRGSYGRMVAVVHCGSVNLNEELLRSGQAVLVTYYCSVSEFASDSWTDCP